MVGLAPVRHFVVIGLGLIGGSLARALRAANHCEKIIGIDADAQAVATGQELGVIDQGFNSIDAWSNAVDSNALDQRDVIYISVPTLAVPQVIESLRPFVKSGVTITDGASVKGSILQAYESFFGVVPANIVLGHPIAGSEKSGVVSSFAELFANKRCILCPLENTSPEYLERVKSLWIAAGAQVHLMKVDTHDAVFAATSHLPHVIAFSLVDTLASGQHSESVFQNAAGGFKEFTRVASSDPKMWTDICVANKAAILKGFDAFTANMQMLRDAIANEDEAELTAAFSRAKAARDHFLCAD